jgi:hypothetical protein
LPEKLFFGVTGIKIWTGNDRKIQFKPFLN